MVEFKTSFNNQWPLDWLKTQVDTTRENTSTIDLKDMPCQRSKHLCNHFNSSHLL